MTLEVIANGLGDGNHIILCDRCGKLFRTLPPTHAASAILEREKFEGNDSYDFYKKFEATEFCPECFDVVSKMTRTEAEEFAKEDMQKQMAKNNKTMEIIFATAEAIVNNDEE